MSRRQTVPARLTQPLTGFIAPVLIASLALTASRAEARDCPPPGGSHFELGEPTLGMALSGGFAYAVTLYFEFYGWGGFVRTNFDVLDLTGSEVKASIPILESPCVEVDRGFAYLGGSEFRVLDVSNPANPHIVGTRPVSSWILDIAVVKSHAYLADEAGLTIMDISDPTSPTPIGSTAIPSARSVAAKGSRVYIASDAGVTIVDVSDPASPSVVGTCGVPGSAWDIAVRGSRAYVVDRSGLRVVDVSQPTRPHLLGSLDALGDAGAVAIDGDRAYVVDWGDATHENSLRVVDISDPARPVVVNSIPGKGVSQGYWNLSYRVERVSAGSGRVAVGGGVTHVWLGDCIAGLFGCDFSSGYVDVAQAEAYEPCSGPDGVASSWSAPERVSDNYMPGAFALRGNDPNPFNPETSIRFDVPRTSRVRIRIFDAYGRLVQTLVDGTLDQGPHRVSWRGRTGQGEAVASGIYIVTMEAEGFHQARKITLLK